MPELPEVETVRRGLEQSALNKIITKIEINFPKLRVPIPPEIIPIATGQKIHALHRRAKYILFNLQTGYMPILHLGMSGRIRIYAPDMNYIPQKHDHVIFELNDQTRLIYHDPRRFGSLTLSPENIYDYRLAIPNLGPEPLSDDWNGPVLYESLKNKKCAIKLALLDQNIVAGLGNIYVCEALFAAKINPLTPANALRPEQSNLLAVAVKDILNKAIAAGGSTLRDYRHTDGSLGYFQYSFFVYDRENQPCPSCKNKSKVIRITQGGRSTFYCPNCQI